jgi:hypothetical protein
VRFNPHLQSLDGTTAPFEDTLCKWGFQDVNTALASTVEAIENTTAAPKRRAGTKKEISSLLKEAIAKGNQTLKQELRADMQSLREDVLVEAHTYTDIMIHDTRFEGQD